MSMYSVKEKEPHAAAEGDSFCSVTSSPSTYRQDHDRLKEAVLHQVRALAASPTAAAKELGVDTQTALHWVQQSGIDVKRRPKKVSPEIRNAVAADLEHGTPKLHVAERHGISVVTVTRILLADHELAALWHRQNSKRMQVNARKQWCDAIRQSKGAGIKKMREQYSAAYAWLYRNDREWLTSKNQVVPSKVMGNHSKLDWLERDKYFHDLLVARCINSASRAGEIKWSVGRVFQLIPELYPQMRNIHKMTTTKTLLEKLVMN